MAAAIASIPAHAATAKPSVTLTPDTQVGPGQYVEVHWEHFDTFGAVFFRQCILKPKNSETQCTPIYKDYGVNDASGSGTLYEELTTGKVASATKGKSFVCDELHPCTLGVFTDPHTLSTGVLVKVTFAPTPDSCPETPGAPVLGGGSTSSFFAMFKWAAGLCRPPHRLTVGYTGTNSIQGIDNFALGLTGSDFAVSGVPPSSTQSKELAQKGKKVTFAPLDASSVVLAYKIFVKNDGQLGRQVTNLKLTPDAVARIFTGQIINWSVNEEINSLNPEYEGQFPSNVRAMARADNAASTWEFTSWLSATAHKALPKDWPGPTEVFPAHYLGVSDVISGEDLLAHAIAQNDDDDYTEFGYIGFLSASYAHYYGLPIAKIQNAAGKFVDATPASIDAGIKDAKTGTDGFLTPSYTKKDSKAYPMPLVDQLMAPTNKFPTTKGDVLRSFITYAVGAGQSPKVLPAGYVPLPQSLRRQALAASKEIPSSAGDEGTPPPPSDGGGGGGGGGGGFTTGGTGGGSRTPSPPPSSPSAHPSLSTAPPPAFEAAAYEAPSSPFVLPAILVFLAMGLVAGPLLRSVAKPGARTSRAVAKLGARFRRGGGA
jgi:ABC-type phosphate transport system substrate-binding protein